MTATCCPSRALRAQRRRQRPRQRLHECHHLRRRPDARILPCPDPLLVGQRLRLRYHQLPGLPACRRGGRAHVKRTNVSRRRLATHQEKRGPTGGLRKRTVGPPVELRPRICQSAKVADPERPPAEERRSRPRWRALRSCTLLCSEGGRTSASQEIFLCAPEPAVLKAHFLRKPRVQPVIEDYQLRRANSLETGAHSSVEQSHGSGAPAQPGLGQSKESEARRVTVAALPTSAHDRSCCETPRRRRR